jgi:riboflavin transporter FmnP
MKQPRRKLLLNAKKLAVIVMMGALGNVLFAVSYFAGPIAPGIALDFSLMAVFIAGFFVGPTEGIVTGVIAGILPGIMFGPAGTGGWLGLIGLPLGKALTGLTAGLVGKSINLQKPRFSLLGIPLTLAAYIPEAIFTYAYFAFLLPLFIPTQLLGNAVIITILIKAVGEVLIMGFVIAALLGNKGFNSFIHSFFGKPQKTLTNTTVP